MDYEKEYKGALARCKWLLSIGMISEIAATDMFRELMDNDSENIRKEIINIFHSLADGKIPVDINYADIFTWLENIPYTIDHEKREGFHLGYKTGLEKQGESSDQIHYWTEEEIEPIISDYLRGAEHYGGMIGRLRCLKPKPLEKQRTSYTKSDVDDAYLKGISDAKNELEKQGEQKSAKTVKWSPQEESCICQLESLVKEQWRQAECVHNSVNVKKMQELMFFLKTLNPNKKPQRMISAEAKEAMYDKPALGEEEDDDAWMNDIISKVENNLQLNKAEIDWLKSLKDRVRPQQQEWSEEDEVMIKVFDSIIRYIVEVVDKDALERFGTNREELFSWLKSLKQRIGE